MLFQLTNEPIIPLVESLPPYSGGIVTFEGRVRTINNGKEVLSLEYEAYPALAIHEGHAIIREATEQFDILKACAAHRTGHLMIGEIAVWIMSAAIHRKEAFQATEYIINAIKSRVPVWKKEYYSDGGVAWVRCDRCSHDNNHAVKEALPL